MAIFASTTLGTGDPSRAMSIKALEARAQALQAAQSKQELPTSLPSPWQGAALVANQLGDALTAKHADQAAAQRRQDLAGYMAQAGDNPTMADVGRITGADADIGKAYLSEIQQRRQQATLLAAQKEAAVTKAQTDEAAAVSAEGRVRTRPQTEGAKIEESVRQGQQTTEQAAEERKKAFGPTAAEQKAAGEAQDANIELQSTVAGLKEAQGLLNKGTVYSGGGAEYKETAGKYLPDALGGLVGVGSDSTKDTQRYNQVVNPQVLDVLSKLKGASSDRDMMFAIGVLNDKSADIETKKKAVDTLIRKSSAHLEASNQRLQTTGKEPVKVQTSDPATAAPAAGGGAQSVASEAEALALPPGTKFKLPDGRTGTAR